MTTHRGHLVDTNGITSGENSFQMPPSFLQKQTLFILFKKLVKLSANSNIFLYKRSQSASKNTFTMIYCSLFKAALHKVIGQSLCISAGNRNNYSWLVDFFFFFKYQHSFSQWVKSFNRWFKFYMTKSLVKWSSLSLMTYSTLCCSVPQCAEIMAVGLKDAGKVLQLKFVEVNSV